MAQQLVLMAEYSNSPIWIHDDRGLSNIDPMSLPLSAQTKLALLAWATRFDLAAEDSTFYSGFDSLADFDEEGVRLWERLNSELGKRYQVAYHSIWRRKVLFAVEELELFAA